MVINHKLKFCNLSNDSENAYIYIIMYETLWFGFKMLKSSKNNVPEENEILLSKYVARFEGLLKSMKGEKSSLRP